MREGDYPREAIMSNISFWGGGGDCLREGDYPREAIMLNISFYGRGDFSRVALIEGRLLFEEIR